MTLEDIKNLSVKNIADDDCILFIWITFPMLEKVFDIINAWGFTYKGLGFNWVKRNKKSDGWFWGLGYWTRQNPEVCLISTKGKPKRVSKSVHSVCDARIMQHSKKPDEIRDRIVELMGDIPRVELFARESHDGWDCIGNEIDGRDIKEVLQSWGKDRII